MPKTVVINRKRIPKIVCKLCDTHFGGVDEYVAHLEREHFDEIPTDMTPWQFFYFQKTDKTHGNCVMCHKETGWNEVTHKYNRFCTNPACKEKYIKEFRQRMIGKYGKITLLNDPEHQKKMLAHRSISDIYTWRNNPRYKNTYTGTYELSFLQFLDDLGFDPEDVISPSPHTYYYEYEGNRKFYIPDFFITSLNLEVEIKDGGDNPNNHHKIQNVDKMKEQLKDNVLKSNTVFNYIKIVNKENMKFFAFLEEAKRRFYTNDTSLIFMP